MTCVNFFILVSFISIQIVASKSLGNEDYLSNFNLSWLFDSEIYNSKISKNKICLKEACKKTAQSILNNMDPGIDPCEDFYSYVCGRWSNNHPIPPSLPSINEFYIATLKVNDQIKELLMEGTKDEDPKHVKAAKNVFKACMNTERIEKRGVIPLVRLLDLLGGWPITNTDWNDNNFNWQDLIGIISKKYGIRTILDVEVNIDERNTSRNVLIINEPPLVIRKDFLQDPNYDIFQPYISFITKAARLIAKEKNDTYILLNLYLQACKMVNFEIKLAKFMRKEEEKKNGDDLYDLVTIRQLQQWTNQRAPSHSISWIDWKKLIQIPLESFGEKITDDTHIVVTNWNYLEKLITLLKKTPPRVLANYILWRVVEVFSKDLNQEMLDISLNFEKDLSGTTDTPRWQYCVETVEKIDSAVAYMYIKKYFSDETIADAKNIIENIRLAFKTELKQSSWLDEKVKNHALEKLDLMNALVGYSNNSINFSAMNSDFYDEIVGEDHFENKEAFLKIDGTNIWKDLNQPTSNDEWFGDSVESNAYYYLPKNVLIIPVGILQEPFFNKDLPESLIYGGLGSLMGHEISHGFDNFGRQRDKFGNLNNWWSKKSEKIFLQKSHCLINQYNSFRVPELESNLNRTVTLNGVLSLGENIADNEGLRAALRAYLENIKTTENEDLKLPGLEEFSSEQLFYIGFAKIWCDSVKTEVLHSYINGDEHTLHKYRVIGSVSNLEHFAATWKCKIGTSMNPEKKCKIW